MDPLASKIACKIDESAGLYHRLIVVVGLSGSGKTAAFLDLARSGGFRYVNVNLEMSRSLLDMTQRQRALQVPRLLDTIVRNGDPPTVLLDNLEILFDPSLEQDPLRCLQGLARHRCVVASWNGNLNNGQLVYAEPGHPEYRRYPANDIVIIVCDDNRGCGDQSHPARSV